MDLSWPPDHSVNDDISSGLASISYASVDEAVQLILHLGRGTQLAKLDLEKAYRNVPVHPQDHHLLAISWAGDYYVDRALPFGLGSAPKIFSAVADVVAWAIHCSGVRHQIHYLDNLLFLGAPDTEEAARALSTAPRVLDYLGLPVALHKMEGPLCCMTFLGIVIDTSALSYNYQPKRFNACRHFWGRGAPRSHACEKS